MIQRLQSVWLLLAAACAFLSYKFPFYTGNVFSAKTNTQVYTSFTASYTFLTLVLAALVGAASLILIFLFKNRKLQLQLTIVTLVLAVLNLVVYFSQMKKFTAGTISITAIFSLAIPVFIFLAARGIWKDDKLVKSLDRLR